MHQISENQIEIQLEVSKAMTRPPLIPARPGGQKNNKKKVQRGTTRMVGTRMVGFQQKVATADPDSICGAATTKVGIMTLRQILQLNTNFSVPIFQRRYCWTPEQWDTLLHDAQRLPLGKHSLGRLTCTNVNDHKQRSCVLDGQQRFTTVTILLASIRDAILRLSSSIEEEDPLVETINKLLFTCTALELEEWKNTVNANLYEGMELSFAKLIPTYCDRWSYYAAILPFQCSNQKEQGALSPSWQRPLQAKKYFDQKILLFNNKQILYKLCRNVLDGFHMLYFPIDIEKQDGTEEDLMVVYERLAVRDATFCKPTRPSEYVSMDGVDMIRNLLLGSFSNTADALEFYKTFWLPIEQTASTSGRNAMNRTIQTMIPAFIVYENNNEEQQQHAGFIGGVIYASFQSWLEEELSTIKSSSFTVTEKQAMDRVGKKLYNFAVKYLN